MATFTYYEVICYYILRSNMLGQRGGLHQLLHILPSAREEGHHFVHSVSKSEKSNMCDDIFCNPNRSGTSNINTLPYSDNSS